MLPITKLYVDSRFKSSDSVSDSDFKIDIPINLLMPENTGFYIGSPLTASYRRSRSHLVTTASSPSTPQ